MIIILKIFEIYIAIYHYNISIIFEEESKIRMPFDNDICYLQLFISVIYLTRGSLALKRYGTPPFCANTVNQLSFTCEKFSGGSQGPRRCEYFSPQTSSCLMVLIPRRIWIRLVANVSRCESVIGSKLRNKVMANKSWITVLV